MFGRLVRPLRLGKARPVRITLAETVSAITRRERGGSITSADAVTALTDFQLEIALQYFSIEVSALLVDQAAALARRHGLRVYDAVALHHGLELVTGKSAHYQRN